MKRPDDVAKHEIDKALEAAGWKVKTPDAGNGHAGIGVAIQEIPLKSGRGAANYLLYAGGNAIGVMGVKQVGTKLAGIYSADVPDHLPEGRWRELGYDEIVKRDKISLDAFWLKDESLEDADNLPPPNLIAAEIIEDLWAAFEQFEEILAELAGPMEAN